MVWRYRGIVVSRYRGIAVLWYCGGGCVQTLKSFCFHSDICHVIQTQVRSDPFSAVPWYRGIIFLDYLLYRYMKCVTCMYLGMHRTVSRYTHGSVHVKLVPGTPQQSRFLFTAQEARFPWVHGLHGLHGPHSPNTNPGLGAAKESLHKKNSHIMWWAANFAVAQTQRRAM